MPRWVFRFSEFAELGEFNEISAPFRENPTIWRRHRLVRPNLKPSKVDIDILWLEKEEQQSYFQ